MPNEVDIKENDIHRISPDLLHLLLKDHTKSDGENQVNIFWATDNYASKGEGYQYQDQIRIEAITGENKDVIRPRAQKCLKEQQLRSREMAEVFTPSWICNKQNNLLDNEWFGRENVFNTEIDNPDGSHTWEVTTDKITFPEGKTWMDYVREIRLEITCGEAPYLVSRYDAVTAKPIELGQRIGLLDRKLRVISENTEKSGEWLEAARTAFQCTYGYEWQGDNLVLARESLMLTFIDYYETKFGKKPLLKSLMGIADIVSWNIWQMDGLKGVIPGSCKETITVETSLFGDVERTVKPCIGCQNDDIKRHNGVYALIMDWNRNKKIRFIDLIK